MVQIIANTANKKNVSPIPIASRIFEKNFVTINAANHDVDPLKLLEIAFASVENISPTRTQVIGLNEIESKKNETF